MTVRSHRFHVARWLVALGVVLLVAAHATLIAVAWRTHWYIALGAVATGVVALKYVLWRHRR
jgi:uncharacterized membrane protein